MGTLELILDAGRWSELLVEAAHWADHIDLCLSAPNSEHGSVAVWSELLDSRTKYERVIIDRAAQAEPWLLHRLHETGTMRLVDGAERSLQGQVLGFRRGDEVRLFLAHVPLARAALESDCGSVVFYQGPIGSDFSLSARRLGEAWRERSRVPAGSELDVLATATPRRSSRPSLSATSPMVIADAQQVTEQLNVLLHLLQASASGGDSGAFRGHELPTEGRSLAISLDADHTLSVTTLADGFRLAIGQGQSGEHSAVLTLQVGAGLASASGFLVRDAEGRVSLAWRGGLFGTSQRRNATLWSQCRLQTFDLGDPVLDRPQRVALVANLDENVAAHLAVFADEVRRLAELFGTPMARATRPELTDFTNLEADEQSRLIWGQLLGLGELSLDEAVSVAAQGLRDEGYVQYQRLRRDGPLYLLLEERISRASRQGVAFDRPRAGHVRAIQPQLDDFEREDWLDCLIHAIPPGKVLDRSTAQRLVFDHARKVWGLSAQRLRTGGKAERALKSTLNSAIRRGLLRRVGAAYLERVPPETESLTVDDTSSSSGTGAHLSHSSPDASAKTAGSPDGGDQDGYAGAVSEAARWETRQPASTTGAPERLVANSSLPSGASVGEHPAQAAAPLGSSDVVETTAPRAVVSSSPRPTASVDHGALLRHPLNELMLPIRTVNWADRKGLQVLRDLVAWHPDAFSVERNVGRLTVAETRVAVEAALGQEWEEAWGELDEPKVAPPRPPEDEEQSSEPLPASEQSRWNRRRAELAPAHLQLPLTRLDLPTRLRAYCEQQGLTMVGELLSVPRDELLAQPNLGRASLVQTLEALDTAIVEHEQPLHTDGLMSGWRRLMQRLPALQRMILARRSGLSGPRETLESLGETLGLTRERVRQIEARCLEDIRNRSALVDELERRLGQAFAGGRCVPLALLIESDPWWSGIEQHPQWADYVFERLLGGGVHRLEIEQDGRRVSFFTHFDDTEWRQTREWLLGQAEQIPTPCRVTDYEPLLDAASQRLDPAIREALQALLEEQFCFDEADPERVLGFGNTKPDQVLALLASQAHPIPVGAVFEAVGRCRLPDEVLYFRRGVVGLELHFPDFQRWSEQLVPACLGLMSELPAGRQWMVIDLHEALRDAGVVPDWLNHWHLASLLRRSGRVDYLGRLRVALPSDGQRQQRIHLEDAVLTVLREANGPLAFDTIARRVRERTDIRDGTLSLMLIASPFVQIGEDAYGLIERDVPGGPDAIARAVEAVMAVLDRDQQGLTTYQAFRLAQAEVAPLVWAQQLVTSLLRSEPQLRLSRSGQVGLVSWDDVRAPSRGEFIRQQVEKAGGRLDLATLDSTLRDTYGGVPTRAELDADCRRHDLLLEPGAVAIRESAAESLAVTPAPEIDLTGRVKGIPAAARQHFDELLSAPIEPAAELLQRARAHLGAIEDAGRHNEFIDVALARRLVELFERLLEHVAGSSTTTQRIARAAVLYFISTDDAEDDFELSGLDDDKAVFDAVARHLELDWM